MARRRPLDGVEHDGARVAALVAPHELDVGPLGPRGELLGGGGAERVAGRQQHRAPVATCWLATLPIVVVLPTPLTPTNSHTFGRRRRRRSAARGRRRSSRAFISARSASSSASGSVDLLGLDLGAQAVEQLGGDVDADVGAQQRLLEVVPRVVGDPAAPEDRGEHAGQRRPRPRHAAAEGGRLDDLDGRRRRWRLVEHRRRRRRVPRGGRSTAGGVAVASPHRSRPAAPAVPDDDADPEDDDDDDEDEVDPDHRRSTLTVGRRLRRRSAATGGQRVRRSARSVRRSPCSTRPAAS